MSQARREKPRREDDQNRRRERQSELKGGKAQLVHQDGGRRSEEGVKPADDKAHRKRGKEKARIGGQAAIGGCHGRSRQGRSAVDGMGFADAAGIVQRERHAECRNDKEGDPPAEQAVKRHCRAEAKSPAQPPSRSWSAREPAPSASPSNRSRAMARDRTEAAQAPSAWMTRPRIRKDKVSAKAQRTLPAAKTARPPAPAICGRSGRRAVRPEAARDAKATKKLLNSRPSSWRGNASSAPIRGKAGRMMLVASAPSAARPASRNRIPPVRRRSEGAGLRSKARTSRLPAHDQACRRAMRVEPALGVLDPALQRDDGPAARNHMADDAHYAGIDEDRADKLGGGFV